MRTEVTQHVAAEPEAVYRALLDPEAVQRWMVPDDMTSEVHRFDAREGGTFAITLTYRDPARAGKTEGASDAFTGTFAELVPGRRVVQHIAFTSDDPGFGGDMRITYALAPEAGGTRVTGTHDGLPADLDPAQNEEGWRSSLAKLARLVEGAS